MGSVSLIGKSMGIGFVRNRHSLDSLPPPLRIELFFDSVNGKKGSFLENELHRYAPHSLVFFPYGGSTILFFLPVGSRHMHLPLLFITELIAGIN
jgi:hypothetical protein